MRGKHWVASIAILLLFGSGCSLPEAQCMPSAHICVSTLAERKVPTPALQGGETEFWNSEAPPNGQEDVVSLPPDTIVSSPRSLMLPKEDPEKPVHSKSMLSAIARRLETPAGKLTAAVFYLANNRTDAGTISCKELLNEAMRENPELLPWFSQVTIDCENRYEAEYGEYGVTLLIYAPDGTLLIRDSSATPEVDFVH